MKTSTSLEHGILCGFSAAETARMMRDAGFDGIDLGLCNGQNDPSSYGNGEWLASIREEIRSAKEAGLVVAQCHLPYYPGHLDAPGNGEYADYEAFLLPMYRRAIDLCGECGCPVAVMHPYFHVQSAAGTVAGNLRMLDKLAPDLRRNGVKIALENCYAYIRGYLPAHVSTAEELMSILEKADSDVVGACIDTGHANLFGVDICAMARIIGNRLLALHVNDNCGQDEHLVPYTSTSKLDFAAFSAALKGIGYGGWYNLELATGKMPPSVVPAFYAYAGAMARALADLA